MEQQEVLSKAQEWVNNSAIDNADRQDIQALIDQNNISELTERFYKDLEFGTGGLRAILGNGSNRINKYNIRRATQALINAVKKATTDESLSLAISYDSRKFSKEFSQEVASVCAANGVKAYLYSHLNPVALLSFAVRYYKCHAGVMVTASHNPPKYNGYKVYWSDGAQVTPPNDQDVIDQYNSLNDWSKVHHIDYAEGVKNNLIEEISTEVEAAYFETIKQKTINPEMCAEHGKDLNIVFTPIHGTGLIPCKRALEQIGFNSILVPEEQAQPDERFPTVTSPNPENPEALAMAVELMDKNNADIVFGTDPDTDRLGVAIRHNGELFYPTGNQIGTLMLHYLFSNSEIPENSYFVKTIVTTDLQRKIADHFGVKTENTLTGFKWICGLMKTIEETQPERNFLFGTEESFGYLNHPSVRDKDGVSAVALMAEVTLWYKRQGLNLVQALDKIYEQFGFHHEHLLCLEMEGKDGLEKIQRIMTYFRENVHYEFNGLPLSEIEDYQIGQKKNLESGNSTSLDQPKSNVLGLYFTSGDIVYLRPSGTEPKIKFYLMVQDSSGDLEKSKKESADKVTSYVAAIKKVADEI